VAWSKSALKAKSLHYGDASGCPGAIGYITHKDKLEGQAEAILAGREAKLAAARESRKAKRKAS